VVLALSQDGGSTWKRSVVPGLTRCSGGTFDYADDPSVTFTADRGLVVSAGVSMGDRSVSGGLSVRSDDGGRTWSRPAVMVPEDDPRKGPVAGGPVVQDPRAPRVMYAVSARFAPPGQGPGTSGNSAVLSRSTDGGRSWESPRTVVDAGQERLATGHRLMVLRDGTLLDLFTLGDWRADPGHPSFTIESIRSADGGRTWSGPTRVAELTSVFFFGDPESGDQVSHTTSLLFDTAIDPRSGRLYAAWQDARFNGGAADGVALAMSGDQGRTWSGPVKVNRTPTGIPVADQQVFSVSLAVAPDGTLAVSHFDFRHNDARRPLLTDRWLVRCHPAPGPSGCVGEAARWRETRLTARSFDMRKAPVIPDAASPRGFFLGERMGLTASGGGFVTAWAQPQGRGRAAVHARAVTAG
jgi:hypothetical protein